MFLRTPVSARRNYNSIDFGERLCLDAATVSLFLSRLSGKAKYRKLAETRRNLSVNQILSDDYPP